MILQIPGGTFHDEPHSYFDDAGVRVPSLTQCLKLCGLSDYDGADPEDMQNASRRGVQLHILAEAWNKFQDCDPSWITADIAGYFLGYQQFLLDTGFQPSPDWAEKPMIVCVAGFRVGMKPDLFGKLNRDDAIVEIKAASCVQASWSIQTALQELGIYQSSHVGRARRFALQLFPSGKYRMHAHTKHAEDEGMGIAALRITHWRLEQGQNVWKHVTG